MEYQSIRVLGLFGQTDHEIPITGKPFFLVGPNGTGKTTILKSVFFSCTGQWDRLSALPISGIEFVGEETTITIEKSDFPLFGRIERLFRTTPRRRTRATKGLWPKTWPAAFKSLKSSRILDRYSKPFLDRIANEYEYIAEIHNFVTEHTKDRFLYFPTYRRVERDLKDLISDDVGENPFEPEPDSQLGKHIENRFERFGEVIGFGGQDIAELIEHKAEGIRQQARLALNEHSIGFLEAIVTADLTRTRSFKNFLIRSDNAEELVTKLEHFAPSKIDTKAIKAEVARLVTKLKGQPWGRLRQKEDMLLYYLSELHSLIQTVDKLSQPLLNLATYLNSYLKPNKSAEMDASNSVYILDRIREARVSFDDLSSGEKQVVAFFAFLLLHKSDEKLIVLLDEPELSLSVSWQKTLVRDLASTGRCSALISATHSPFIVESSDFRQILTLGAE